MWSLIEIARHGHGTKTEITFILCVYASEHAHIASVSCNEPTVITKYTEKSHYERRSYDNYI